MFALLIFITGLLLAVAVPIAVSILVTGSPLLGVALVAVVLLIVAGKIRRTLSSARR